MPAFRAKRMVSGVCATARGAVVEKTIAAASVARPTAESERMVHSIARVTTTDPKRTEPLQGGPVGTVASRKHQPGRCGRAIGFLLGCGSTAELPNVRRTRKPAGGRGFLLSSTRQRGAPFYRRTRRTPRTVCSYRGGRRGTQRTAELLFANPLL